MIRAKATKGSKKVKMQVIFFLFSDKLWLKFERTQEPIKKVIKIKTNTILKMNIALRTFWKIKKDWRWQMDGEFFLGKHYFRFDSKETYLQQWCWWKSNTTRIPICTCNPQFLCPFFDMIYSFRSYFRVLIRNLKLWVLFMFFRIF